VTDLAMPRSDVAAFAEALARHCGAIPVLYLRGERPALDAARSESGETPRRVLTVPFTAHTLVSTAVALLRRTQAAPR
jgi:CheY-like chemotaxis protein